MTVARAGLPVGRAPASVPTPLMSPGSKPSRIGAMSPTFTWIAVIASPANRALRSNAVTVMPLKLAEFAKLRAVM